MADGKDHDDGERAYPVHCPNYGPTPVVKVRGDGTKSMTVSFPLREGRPLPPGAEHFVHVGGGEYRKMALGGGQGPAQVATEDYRQGWETIFGKKQPVGEA